MHNYKTFHRNSTRCNPVLSTVCFNPSFNPFLQCAVRLRLLVFAEYVRGWGRKGPRNGKCGRPAEAWLEPWFMVHDSWTMNHESWFLINQLLTTATSGQHITCNEKRDPPLKIDLFYAFPTVLNCYPGFNVLSSDWILIDGCISCEIQHIF